MTDERPAGGLITNTLYNLLGRVWSLLLSLAATPYIVHSLGETEYGLYSLAGFLASYFAFMDAGLAPATEKFVAEHRSVPPSPELRKLVWASAVFYLIIGAVGATLIIGLSPWLGRTLVHAPAEYTGVTRTVLYCAAASFGLAMLELAPSAALRGIRQFGWLNLFVVAFGTLRVVTAVTLLHLGADVRGVMVGQIGVQIVWIAAEFGLLFRMVPFAETWDGVIRIFRKLLVFGLWMSVSRFVGPFIMHFEKLMISRSISVGALTYYSIPYNLLVATWFIPQAIVGVITPYASEWHGAGRIERVRDLHRRVAKYSVLYMTPIAVGAIWVGREGLSLWLGAEFAARGATVLKILAVGSLIHVAMWSSGYILNAINRPDLTAKASAIETLLYIPAAYFLVAHYGIEGAALAWAGRVLLDAALLFLFAARNLGLPITRLLLNLFPFGFWLAVAVALGLGAMDGTLPFRPWLDEAIRLTLFGAAYAWIAWFLLLDGTDRDAFTTWLRTLGKRLHRAPSAR